MIWNLDPIVLKGRESEIVMEEVGYRAKKVIASKIYHGFLEVNADDSSGLKIIVLIKL